MVSKKVVVAGIAAGVLVGGAALYFTRRKEEDEPTFEQRPAINGSSTSPDSQVVSAPATAAAGAAESPSSLSTQYSFKLSEQNEHALQEQRKAEMAAVAAGMPREGVLEYPHLGLVLALPAGWMALEDVSPAPNVAMINISKPEFAERASNADGTVPVVLMSVEDISNEHFTLEEFKDKSKNLALTQMLMMTRGMFQPVVTFDGPLNVGPFKHCLEYVQNTPYFAMHFMNLIVTEGGFAYVMQLMGSPQIFEQYKSDVMTMARNMHVLSIPQPKSVLSTSFALVTVPGATFRMLPAWIFASGQSATGSLATLRTPSQSKPDTVMLFKNSNAPDCGAMQLVSEQKRGDITIRQLKSTTTAKETKIYKSAQFTLVVTPDVHPSPVVADDACCETLESVAPVDASPSKTSLQYFNYKHGIQFDLLEGSKLLESRVGDRTIIYAPLGLASLSQEEEGPMMTIRMGNPTNDPDCRPDLDSWLQRLEDESANSEGVISRPRRDMLHDAIPCLRFDSKEMQEVAPGQQDERQARVYIVMRGMETIMIRWESPANIWARHERKLTALLDSFKVL